MFEAYIQQKRNSFEIQLDVENFKGWENFTLWCNYFAHRNNNRNSERRKKRWLAAERNYRFSMKVYGTISHMLPLYLTIHSKKEQDITKIIQACWKLKVLSWFFFYEMFILFKHKCLTLFICKTLLNLCTHTPPYLCKKSPFHKFLEEILSAQKIIISPSWKTENKNERIHKEPNGSWTHLSYIVCEYTFILSNIDSYLEIRYAGFCNSSSRLILHEMYISSKVWKILLTLALCEWPRWFWTISKDQNTIPNQRRWIFWSKSALRHRKTFIQWKKSHLSDLSNISSEHQQKAGKRFDSIDADIRPYVISALN